MSPNRPRDRRDDPPGDRALDADAVFEALAKDRRRRVVRVLQATDDEITIQELARRVVSRERETTLAAVSSEETTRVATRLYHSDIPKLRSASLIECDDRTRETRLLVGRSTLSDVLVNALETGDT